MNQKKYSRKFKAASERYTELFKRIRAHLKYVEQPIPPNSFEMIEPMSPLWVSMAFEFGEGDKAASLADVLAINKRASGAHESLK